MIRPKIKHLRHPLRTATAARNLLSLYLNIKSVGDRGERRYRGDSRYDLMNVSKGFTPRVEESPADAQILERICAAYIRAAERERFESEVYKASPWWRQILLANLGPVTQALHSRDIASLSRMYSNFYRNPGSTGLIGVPYGMTKAYFGGQIPNMHRRFYLGDALYGIDHWKAQTEDRYPLHVLGGPEIGNPFGVMIGKTLVRTGAAYQHYCAHKIASCLHAANSTVVEFGGGFGGMAYYLLRDRPGVKYVDFDVPESLALTSYYLLKSFPHLKFLLYGESYLMSEALAAADVVLMPLFEMESLASNSVDVVFSSHAMSDISPEAAKVYVKTIARVATGSFQYIGNARGAEAIRSISAETHLPLRLDEMRASGWNVHRDSNVDEVECQFTRVGAAQAASVRGRRQVG
jgi:hypothetical protein